MKHDKPACIVDNEILQDMFWFVNSYILLVRNVCNSMLQGFWEKDQRRCPKVNRLS
jgi:hypothetical protein